MTSNIIIQQEESHQFHQHLGKFSCLMIGVGGLIGGGIFSVIGTISQFTGPYSYISYLITGLITLITVYSYQKLNMKWNGPGGEYSVVKEAFLNTKYESLGDFVGILLNFGYIVSMALYTYTFSVYFLLLFNVKPDIYSLSLTVISLYSIFTLLNLKGVEESARFQNVLVMIKVLILIAFSVLGLIYALRNPTRLLMNVGFESHSFGMINIGGIIIGSAAIIVSYQGFQLIAYGSHEMKDISGGMRMMRLSVIISLLVYVSVGFTALAVLGLTKLIGTGNDAEIAIANAALSFMGPFGAVIVIIGALLSTSSALNATILGSSRLIYMLGKDGMIFKKLSVINKNKVPGNAIILISILSVTFTIVTGGALAIATVAGLIFSQVFFVMNFTNYKVRKKTSSKSTFPIIGMLTTSFMFVILLCNNILNFEKEYIALIIFILIELFTASMVILIYLKKQKISNVLS
jgi:amino acid transporter